MSTSSYDRIVQSLIKHPRYSYRDSYLEGLSQTDYGTVGAFNVELPYRHDGTGKQLMLKMTIVTKLAEEELADYDPGDYLRHFPRPAGSRNCLVYAHSHHGCRAEGTYLVKFLAQFDASLVVFDFSGAGESEGDFTSFGWWEADQLTTVIGRLIGQFKFEHIGLWGKSMGACAALRYRSLARHPQLRFMVVDSSFDKLKHALISIAKEHSKAPTFAIKTFMYFLSKTVQEKAHFDIYKVKPIDWVPNIKDTPIVFVKGQVDNLVTKAEFYSLYTSCSSDKSLKTHIETTGNHAGNRLDDDSFRHFITGFVAKYFPPAVRASFKSAAQSVQAALRLGQAAGTPGQRKPQNVPHVSQFHFSTFYEFNKTLNPSTGLLLPDEENESPQPQTFAHQQAPPSWPVSGSNSPQAISSNEFDSPVVTKPRSITLQHTGFKQPSIPQPLGSPRFNGGLLAGFRSPTSFNAKPQTQTAGFSKPLPPPPPNYKSSQKTPIFDSISPVGNSMNKPITVFDHHFVFDSMLEAPNHPTQNMGLAADAAPANENHNQYGQIQGPNSYAQADPRNEMPQAQQGYNQPASNQQVAQQSWQQQRADPPQYDYQAYEYQQPNTQAAFAQPEQTYYMPSRSSAPAQINYFNPQEGYSQNHPDNYDQLTFWPAEQHDVQYEVNPSPYINNQQQPQTYPDYQQQPQPNPLKQSNPYFSRSSQHASPKQQKAANVTDSLHGYFDR